MTAVKAADAETLRANEKKWSKPLMDAGWNAFPSIIIEKQQALGLDPIDMNIVLHLTQYWWKADNLPHPSVATIAAAIGVKPRTVQKRIAALQATGLMERTERRYTRFGSITNEYSFAGLIKAVMPHAVEKLEARAERAKEHNERIARKRPKLSLVKKD